MHQIISFSEPERWERAYARISCKDIYYRHAYAELCHCMGDGEPFLFVYEDDEDNTVCYVFIRRRLQALPFARDARLEGEWYDIISPTYGYGGPLCAKPHEQLLWEFRAEFEAGAAARTSSASSCASIPCRTTTGCSRGRWTSSTTGRASSST
ncbi:hypothetical protein ACN28S_48040 [Cystobacter fuscus]